MRFLEWEVRSDFYGPSLKPGEFGPVLKTQFPDLPQKYAGEIAFVASWFGNKNVAELERLTTAIYVTLEERPDPGERARHIHYLKPHVSVTEAETAVREADVLVQAARNRFARTAMA